MNIDELASKAVAALAERFAGQVSDSIGTLIADRLRASRAGSHALDALSAEPEDSTARELTSAVLTDEFTRDASFAQAVAGALGRPTAQLSSLTTGKHTSIHGDAAAGAIDKSRKFQIGSIHFGGGGLAAVIAILLIVGGGTGFGIYSTVTGTSTENSPLSSTTPSPRQSSTSEFERGSKVSSSGFSVDLDALDQRPDGDGLADITLDHTSIAAANGALTARLPPGTPPNPANCDRALTDRTRTPAVDNVAVNDLLCVRTSRQGIAAVTILVKNTVNAETALKTTIYSLDWRYWKPQ
ncbi:hypothetical protein BJY24_007300 [Nocardia transvalensis]|uniref:Uncharacterized protein n=1 Tax=Nocardia transvalensis TaxID=37333 RepID=A0A7W9PML2_9NOCA|nr:hypothetical protein [Nocardia transvalensis]MBB5918388.1 hypothetical protein [Nocardia transvalensis]